jgi:hypothetical protein
MAFPLVVTHLQRDQADPDSCLPNLVPNPAVPLVEENDGSVDLYDEASGWLSEEAIGPYQDMVDALEEAVNAQAEAGSVGPETTVEQAMAPRCQEAILNVSYYYHISTYNPRFCSLAPRCQEPILNVSYYYHIWTYNPRFCSLSPRFQEAIVNGCSYKKKKKKKKGQAGAGPASESEQALRRRIIRSVHQPHSTVTRTVHPNPNPAGTVCATWNETKGKTCGNSPLRVGTFFMTFAT